MSEFNDNDFAALKCLVNYSRSQRRCTLEEAKKYALSMGHTQESIDAAVKFWANYEGNKQWRA